MRDVEVAELIKRLKMAVELKNDEVTHVLFDEILYIVAKSHSPELVKELDEITKEVEFLCA